MNLDISDGDILLLASGDKVDLHESLEKWEDLDLRAQHTALP